MEKYNLNPPYGSGEPKARKMSKRIVLDGPICMFTKDTLVQYVGQQQTSIAELKGEVKRLRAGIRAALEYETTIMIRYILAESLEADDATKT